MEIDPLKYKVWDKKSPIVIHYMLNPALAINELILGQRIPKITLIDRTSDKPLMERTYVPCMKCETFHDSRTWSAQNKTGLRNWFGLYCPNCGEIIPCIRNWTSALILMITYPLWFWWVGKWKQSWVEKQPARYSNIKLEKIEHKKINWLLLGLLWGAIMFVVMHLIPPLIDGKGYNQTILLINLPIWAFSGLAFGYTMKWWMGLKVRKTK